jgi:glucose-6-phosphate 1-dehydrogenase
MHIESVQITMAESFGVEGRGSFYEEAGAIRDVVQNHLLQVAALLMMEPPAGNHAEAIRDATGAAFKSMRTLRPEDVVRGQYESYRRESNVPPNSQVETFASVRLMADSWRWAGVPFYIRAGKCLPVKVTEVYVWLKQPPQMVFHQQKSIANHFRFRLSPNVIIELTAQAKRPGDTMEGESVRLDALQETVHDRPPYERLLGDAMKGDATLFAREDAIEAAWRIVDPVLDGRTPIQTYKDGTWPDTSGLMSGATWHRVSP